MARKDRENLEQLMAANPKLQEQLEERIAAAVAEARVAWEAEQEVPEEEVAEPSEPEEARRLAEERQALEAEKAAFARQRMEVAVGQELCKRNLPAAFAPWLAGETAEESAQRLDTFEVLFQEAIAQAVTSRMRGSGAPKAPETARGYSWQELRNMTHQEINANWTAIQKALESGG